MVGGAGSDRFWVDNPNDVVIELAGAPGIDTVLSSVSYRLNNISEVENLTLNGTCNLQGVGNALANVLTGNTGANMLAGAGGNDTLYGGAGNDTLVGGAGADRMVGGAGADRFIVDNPNDVVVELPAWAGRDTVVSSISYRLSTTAAIENLTLTGTRNLQGFGNALANALTGNAGDNLLGGGAGADTLFGGAGNDTLVGGPGADRLVGGAGADRFVVDDPNDVVVELPAWAGRDTVVSSVSFRLGTTAAIENLTLTGTQGLTGVGNALANVLIGNTGANMLAGAGGADTLYGGAGNDTLVGGAGADSMMGGAGADRFIVDDPNDVVVELPTWAGRDTVVSSVDFRLGTTAAIENLTLTGTRNLQGFGNALANVLTGNAGDNRLEGGANADTLIGGDGNDTLVGGNGADAFLFDSAPDADNVDTIVDFETGRDRLVLRMAVFTGIGAGRLGNALFAEGTEAQDADDRFFYDHDSGTLWYDPDGTGDIRAQLIAEFTTTPDLNAADIFLV